MRTDQHGQTYVIPGSQAPRGYQKITNLAASTALAIPDGARVALIQAETQAVRWRDDGVAPTATVGMTLPVGATLDYNGDLAALRFIQSSASAALSVAYYG